MLGDVGDMGGIDWLMETVFSEQPEDFHFKTASELLSVVSKSSLLEDKLTSDKIKFYDELEKKVMNI